MKPLTYAAASLILMMPVFALAQTGAGANASAAAETPAGQVRASATTPGTAVVTRAKARADEEITRRITALNSLLARIDAMTKVTDDFKRNLKANTQVQIDSLAALKVKIAGEADPAALRTDIQSITGAYRVFALVLPQARIAAASDREATILGMLIDLGTKLQARLQALQQSNGSVDEAAAQALADMGAKIQSAQAHAQAAVTGSATLTPDGGDKAKMEANTAALKASVGDVQAAQKDILAARADIDIIVKALRAAGVSASASSTLQTR